MPFCFRKCRFALSNLRFGCERAFPFGNLRFHFWNAVKLRNFAIWFQKMAFLSQTAVFVLRFWWPQCTPQAKRFRPLSVCTLPCPVCLSETLVYCGQTVGWIKIKLAMQVGLGSGHIVFRWRPNSPCANGDSPQFSVHVCCCQMAGCIKMPLGIEVGSAQATLY